MKRTYTFLFKETEALASLRVSVGSAVSHGKETSYSVSVVGASLKRISTVGLLFVPLRIRLQVEQGNAGVHSLLGERHERNDAIIVFTFIFSFQRHFFCCAGACDMSAAEPQKRCRCIPPPPYSPVLTLAIVATAMTITQIGTKTYHKLFKIIGWAGFSVLIKATTAREDHHVDPLVFSLLRDAGAVPVLMILALSIDGVQPIKIKDLPVLCLGGTIGLFVNQVSFRLGFGVDGL